MVHHPMVHGAPSDKSPLDKRHNETPVEKRFDGGNLSFEDSKEASSDVARAATLSRRWATVLTPRSNVDRDNLFKVAMLVASGVIAEEDVAKILNCMISDTRQDRIRQPMGYFLDALRQNLEKYGDNLSALMKSVDLNQRCAP